MSSPPQEYPSQQCDRCGCLCLELVELPESGAGLCSACLEEVGVAVLGRKVIPGRHPLVVRPGLEPDPDLNREQSDDSGEGG